MHTCMYAACMYAACMHAACMHAWLAFLLEVDGFFARPLLLQELHARKQTQLRSSREPLGRHSRGSADCSGQHFVDASPAAARCDVYVHCRLRSNSGTTHRQKPSALSAAFAPPHTRTQLSNSRLLLFLISLNKLLVIKRQETNLPRAQLEGGGSGCGYLV